MNAVSIPTVQKKVCLLGDFAVGKTSLTRRFVESRFDDRYLSTLGVKISRRAIMGTENAFNLLIWDLAGGDDYSHVESSYITGATGALLVCDLTRPETLDTVRYYKKQLIDVVGDIPLIILANKVDLTEERIVSDEQLDTLAEEIGCQWLPTSAKTGLNVEEAFQTLTQNIETLM